MTAEEKLREVFLERSEIRFAEYPYNDTFDATITAMQEYAEMKCKKLLEIVAEKASAQLEYDCCIIDKDSILNCVDLEKFCY